MNDEVEVRYRLSAPLPVAQHALWARLGDELAELVGDGARTELVVTDDFPRQVGALEREVPWEFGPRENGQEAYDPGKADGAQAAGRTMQLPDRAVIVVDARAAGLGAAVARRLVHHEGRHARLRHDGNMAWAMHRRQPFTRPAGFPFAYVYLAQTLLDEYRCEAAVAAPVVAADAAMTVTPFDWPAVAAIFASVRERYGRTGDLERAFADFLAGLNRVASFGPYAAAAIARGDQRRADWAAAAPVLLALDGLSGVPDADKPVTPAQLADTVADLVTVVGDIAQALGFAVEVDEQADTMSFYLL